MVLFQQDLELRYTWIQNPVPGFDGSDWSGKQDVDLMERAEDAAVTEGLKRKVIRAGVGVRQEVLVQIQGVERHYDLLVEPLRDAAGLISGVTCAAIDITARKQAEEALSKKTHFLHRISEVTPGVLHVFDLAERRAVFINRSVATVLGFSPEEVAAMGTEVVLGLMHPDDLPRFAQHLARITTLADGEVADFEHRMRDQAGDWHWFHSHDAVFARDAAGGARQLIGVGTEVTERERAEEALRESEERFRATFEQAAVGIAHVGLDGRWLRVNGVLCHFGVQPGRVAGPDLPRKRKDEFLAMLGHELRNPLAAIRHAVQIAHETPDDYDACHWAAEVINCQSAQLSRMVDDLLDVALINRGRIDLRPETLDLQKVLESAVAVVQPLVKKRRHHFIREIGSNLLVTGDAARLEQVFVNLLNNAAKYTPETGTIRLEVHCEDAEVIVTICDNGVGIPSDLLPHVFDLFRQADSTLDRAQGGLGIGLSVVQSLVENAPRPDHGGKPCRDRWNDRDRAAAAAHRNGDHAGNGRGRLCLTTQCSPRAHRRRSSGRRSGPRPAAQAARL